MGAAFREMLETESIVVEELLSIGYPRNSIIMEGQLEARKIVDFVIVDTETRLPLMMIEVKSCSVRTSSIVEQNAFKDLKKHYDNNIPVKAVAAIVNRDEQKLKFIDFTEAVKENDFARKVDDYLLPEYEDLTIGAKQKVIKEKEIKQEKNINVLKRLCWKILPPIGGAILLLDALGIYTLSVLRLIVIGVIAGITLIPCFKEITIGQVSLKQLAEELEIQNKKKDE